MTNMHGRTNIHSIGFCLLKRMLFDSRYAKIDGESFDEGIKQWQGSVSLSLVIPYNTANTAQTGFQHSAMTDTRKAWSSWGQPAVLD